MIREYLFKSATGIKGKIIVDWKNETYKMEAENGLKQEGTIKDYKAFIYVEYGDYVALILTDGQYLLLKNELLCKDYRSYQNGWQGWISGDMEHTLRMNKLDLENRSN